MSENVENPPEKRQRFAQIENEDLDILLNALQAQSTKYNTASSTQNTIQRIFYCF